MKDNQLVSIIMPAYNAEKYIKYSILSVINQTYTKWELIIINDGSKDKTVEIIKKTVNKDDRVVFVQNNGNQGVSVTRNKGISMAKGNWIAFLDSDDIWKKTKLEKQISYVNEKQAEFVFTGSSFINEEGSRYQGVFQVPDVVDYQKLRTHNVISCSSVLIKKKFFDNIKMEGDDMHEDYAVWLRILKKGVYAYGINEPLLIYRISRDSKSGNKFKSIIMSYKVFRFIGIKPLGSIYFTLRHLTGAFIKYKNIKSLE